ncbi:alkaline phosphatase family protein [Rhodohalobacter sp. SW132]|uniref:alkaline phosphatase family protein n=1 Tax=Rhodohalobacter sp. SW132 TaxID=2293433 RepID=UPI0013156EB8|nr:alkaline phosphatase family protein [Rhodohalobacter sp. SW132]
MIGITLAISPKLKGADSPKLILIHMDAVSIEVIREEIQAGNLPNIETHFKEQGLLERAITYYPSKTPFIISNIRQAIPSSEGALVGWEIPGFEDEQSYNLVDSFLTMAFSKHRPARANLFYGLPLTNKLNRPALMNTLDLFDDYPVIEFYWYAIDTFGHFYGKEGYLEKLYEFDSAIGAYMSKLDDDINIIIYSDHGMVFGEGIEIESHINELFSDQVKTFSYPSIYLHDLSEIDEVAQSIARETELDFTFYLLDEVSVIGYSEESKLYFDYRDNSIRYRFEGDDPFKYYENGYEGEYLTADEWLLFSAELDYPATPIKVYTYLLNPNSGDIVTSFNNQKFAKTFYSSMGNHGGFSATDVLVPVLVSGPDVDYIGDFEVLWLQELFNEVQDFEFQQNPARDKHYLSSRYNFRRNQTHLTASISPVYRTNFGADLTFDSSGEYSFDTVWGRYDLYRSYLTRLWFGAGIDFRKEDTVGVLSLKHELRIRRFTARTTLDTSGFHRLTFGYRITPHLTAELNNFTGFGFRFSL